MKVVIIHVIINIHEHEHMNSCHNLYPYFINLYLTPYNLLDLPSLTGCELIHPFDHPDIW